MLCTDMINAASSPLHQLELMAVELLRLGNVAQCARPLVEAGNDRLLLCQSSEHESYCT